MNAITVSRVIEATGAASAALGAALWAGAAGVGLIVLGGYAVYVAAALRGEA